MSKLKAAAAVMISAAALFASCGSGRAPSAADGPDGSSAADTAISENDTSEEPTLYDISIKSLRPTEKTGQSGYVKDDPEALAVYMAKNEREALQLVISSGSDVDGLTLSCECGIGCELLRVAYVPCGDEKLPDPVLPLKNGFRLNAGQNVAVIARFRTEENTPAGEYEARFTLSRGGETIAEKQACVKVWNFALPAGSYCRTAFGLNRTFIENAHGVSGEESVGMYRRYYDYLLDNHVCSYSLPYDILDPRADAYMSDPRVNMFVVPYGTDDEIRAYYGKLSSDPEWLKKAVFYPLDEPTNPDMITKLIGIGERLSGLFPGYRMVTPYFTNISYKGVTQTEAMTGTTNVWCPKLFCFDTDKKEFGGFSDIMKSRQAEGDEVWWYVCWEPGKPYTNLYVDEDGLDHRLMFWQQRAADVTGFLYWCANYWKAVPDPWQSMVTVPDLSKEVYGDGSVLYSGVPAGISGPCGSLRLIQISDGVEDFDLITLAIQKLGREKTDEIVSRVTQSPRRYTSDDEVLFAARKELGEMLSE